MDCKSLSNEDLDKLIQQASGEKKSRQPRFQVSDIKPGMKPEDLARARQEIAEVLKEGGY